MYFIRARSTEQRHRLYIFIMRHQPCPGIISQPRTTVSEARFLTITPQNQKNMSILDVDQMLTV